MNARLLELEIGVRSRGAARRRSPRAPGWAIVWLLSTGALGAACGSDPSDNPPGTPGGIGGAAGAGATGGVPDPGTPDAGSTVDAGSPTPAPRGLHAVGNHIEDGDGKTVLLRGVNRSGSEYMCIQGRGIFDGPSDATSVRAIASWKANAVRVPLNEDCWLAINGAPAAYAGASYQAAIAGYVATLQAQGLVPILDLHWTAPGTLAATRLQPMPDLDHSVSFWSQVAAAFAQNTGVVLEPFNEPYPLNNQDSDAAWTCWRDGCTTNVAPRGTLPATYPAVGMQALVSAIRDAGAPNLILLGGVQFSNTLTQWMAFKPTDPLGNLGATWHAYNFNACITPACWDGAPAAVAAAVPLVATEFGERDCAATFVAPLMDWLDAHAAGYLAWAWDAYGVCDPYVSAAQPGNPFSLIGAGPNDYSGTPNAGYGQAIFAHLTSF